jgi:hypothetical protein
VRRWKVGARQASLGCAFAASVLVFSSHEASAAPPQVTVYVNNYGAAAPSQTTPAQVSGAGGVTPAEATLAQVAAYQQYLLYLNVAKNQPPGAGANAAQYFNNGAAVTSVPSAGQPGGAYFSNGASATSVPSAGQPGAAYFSNGAEATRLAPLAPTATPPPSPAPASSAPLPPGWWTEPATPAGKTAPASAPPSAPAPAAAPVVATMQEPAMSFQEWLRTMGATAPQVAAPETPEPPEPPALAAMEEEAPPVAELSTTVNDVRQRASYQVRAREKTRERIAKRAPGPLGIIGGAFAVGILLGAVVMRRARVALQHSGNAPGNATSGR